MCYSIHYQYCVLRYAKIYHTQVRRFCICSITIDLQNVLHVVRKFGTYRQKQHR